MSLLSKLTVTPLLYACGVLLLACMALGASLAIANSRVDAAHAAAETAQAQRQTAITERDSWKNTAQGGADANRAATDAIHSLVATLDQQQQQWAAMRDANQRAIAAARADATDADRTLKRFAEQFQQESRKPECGQALAALDTLCPALEGY